MIEVAPLAFMRGRTLNDTFVILDEAQNTTPEQMKMFLTRLGFGPKWSSRGRHPDRPAGGSSGLSTSELLGDDRGDQFVRLGASRRRPPSHRPRDRLGLRALGEGAQHRGGETRTAWRPRAATPTGPESGNGNYQPTGEVVAPARLAPPR